MSAFLDATTFTADGPRAWTGTVTDDWLQGRGLFGGVVCAAAVRALSEDIDDDRRCRTLHTAFLGPAVPGPLRFESEVLKTGRRVTYARGVFRQDGAPVASVTATFATTRDNPIAYDEERTHPLPALTELPIVQWQPPMPVFTKHYEMRFAEGAPPYSGADRGFLAGALRLREPAQVDAALVVGTIDAFPPAVIGRLDRPTPAATADLTIDLVADPARLAHEPSDVFWIDVRSRWANDGYAEQLTRLFSADHKLVATCRQLVAILG